MIHIGEKTAGGFERRLVVDGVEGSVSVFGKGDNTTIEIDVDDPALFKAISSHRFNEFPEISHLALSLKLDWLEWVTDAVITQADAAVAYELEIGLGFSRDSWNRLWTMATYADELERLIGEGLFPGLWFQSGDDNFPFIIHAGPIKPDTVIGEALDRWLTVIRQLHETAERNLAAAQHADSLTTRFNFPPAIATACEQYLLYFVQFLADLGIEAQAEVKHEAAEVLFRVTPAGGREALEQVHKALEAYLSLPTDPTFAVVAAQEHDLAVKQLEFNVHQLKGQLMLAQMYLDAKDRSIEALELSNYRLRQLAGGEVQAIGRSGAAPTSAAGEDSEAIIPGVVSVKDVEKGGVVVHTAEIVRRLKRRFGW